MEACLRHLRDGVVGKEGDLGHTPLLLLSDNLACVGGSLILQKLCNDYLQALQQQRTQATHVVAVSLQGLPLFATDGPGPATAGALQHIDAFSDVAGWLKDTPSVTPQTAAPPPSLTVHVAQPGALQRLFQLITAGPGSGHSGAPTPHSLCVVLDSVSPLLLYHSATQVQRFILQLQGCPAVSCVIAGLQQDQHAAHTSSGLLRCATCHGQLHAVSSLLAGALARAGHPVPHTRLELGFKSRRAGRVRTEHVLVSVGVDGTLQCFTATPELTGVVTSEALVSLALRQPPSSTGATSTAPQPLGLAGKIPANSNAEAAGATPGWQAGGGQAGGAPGPGAGLAGLAAGMRLTVTEEERKARAAVVLPYEHQGQAAAYHTGDWRDYLPPEAGGHGAGPAFAQPPHGSQLSAGMGVGSSGHGAGPVAPQREGRAPVKDLGSQLGSILYVRDSDDENGGLHDSDEDPDDDLDL